jgi:hypothetical protein
LIAKAIHIRDNFLKLERESDGDSKKIYEHKRKRGFIDSWSKNFDGLQDSSDGMIRTYCKKFPNIAEPSSFIYGNKSYRKDGIRSPKHLQPYLREPH